MAIRFIVAAIRIYTLLILVRAIFSWLPPRHRQNNAYDFIHMITEPVLAPVRRMLPPAGGIDFSPLIALLLLEVLRSAVLSLAA
jgi:YggT family protein